jgi:predicted metalloprotease with PDZ domain
MSGGRNSLDDFARAFFGVNDGSYEPATYSFEDVVKTLNGVQPHDWAKFLRARLDTVGAEAPLDGLARGGYRLIYSDNSVSSRTTSAAAQHRSDLFAGHGDGREAKLTDVRGGPRSKQGSPWATIVILNGLSFDADRLKTSSTTRRGPRRSIHCQEWRSLSHFRIDYHGDHAIRISSASATASAARPCGAELNPVGSL